MKTNLLNVWLLLACTATDASVTYTYSGNNFDVIADNAPPSGTNFDVSKSISVTLTTPSLLINLNNETITPTSFTISNGVTTLTESSTLDYLVISLTTNASGDITSWVINVAEKLWSSTWFVGEQSYQIVTTNSQDITYLYECLSLNIEPTCASIGSDTGQTDGDPGVWTTAETMTFDAFEQAGTSFTLHANPVQVGEYQFTAMGGTSSPIPVTWQQDSSAYVRTNSASLTATNSGDLVLSRIDNGAFDLLSIDLDKVYSSAPAFEFVGQLVGGGTVEQTFTADDLPGNQTLNLVGFIGINAVTMSALGTEGLSNIGTVDNVVVVIPPADTDMDGVPDYIEDSNGNGVVDAGETDPSNPDTDGDGLSDGIEINVIATDPTAITPLDMFDSDGDGLTDSYEINVSGTDPSSSTTVITGPLGDMNGDDIVDLGDHLLHQRLILGL